MEVYNIIGIQNASEYELVILEKKAESELDHLRWRAGVNLCESIVERINWVRHVKKQCRAIRKEKFSEVAN